jgi:uncharacterized protein (DUF58 family)
MQLERCCDMRPSQYLIRLVVFVVVALDPSGGCAGIALGVAIGGVIGAAAGINSIRKKRSETTENGERDQDRVGTHS